MTDKQVHTYRDIQLMTCLVRNQTNGVIQSAGWLDG